MSDTPDEQDEVIMTPVQIGRSWEHNLICRAGEHYDWTGGEPFRGEHVLRERVNADVIVEFCSRAGKPGYQGPSYMGLCWEHWMHRRERHAMECAPLIAIGHLRIHLISDTAKRRGKIRLLPPDRMTRGESRMCSTK